MKLAINKTTNKGEIVTDEQAAALADTHRVVNATSNGATSAGHHYTDVWGGTWMVDLDGKTRCTVGVMEKWS